jgi:curli production assembly/transport component CsgG
VKPLLLYLLVALLFSCSSTSNIRGHIIPKIEPPQIRKLLITELARVDPPVKKPIVAVYAGAFGDDTGQRRSNGEYASFSTAITQQPVIYLIRALHHAGVEKRGFFDVVDRVGLDHLAKERQIIRSARQEFQEDNKLKPLLFAGLLMEGSVVGYESNLTSGGSGARYLGIGVSRKYRQDIITISLRTISVLTGKVLIEVLVTKTVLSTAQNQDAFKFIYSGTELIEVENGLVQNESLNIALQTAIETAVLQTIKEGVAKKYWEIQND